MAKALKRMLVTTYEGDLGGSPSVILVDPGSMSVETTQAFRRDLREKAGGARVRVIHNRTARRALGALWAGSEAALDDLLVGPSAILFGGTGPGSIAKVLRDWRRKHKALKVKGGVAEGEVLDAKGVDALADLPDLAQVRSMLLSAILGPARGIAVALRGVPGGLTRAVAARVEKAGGDDAAPSGDATAQSTESK